MINPGILKLVDFLNKNGFETCDSGDGETHQFDCDRELAYVVIKTDPEHMISEARRLLELFELIGADIKEINLENNPAIQASYDPVNNTSFIDVTNLSDKDINWEQI